MTVDTKTSDRREVTFTTVDGMRADLDALMAAHERGTLRSTGNWTPGQVLEHIAKFWGYALDGFPPGKPPLLLRIIAQLLFKKGVRRGDTPPPGFKIPDKAAFLRPDDDVTFEQGMGELRAVIDRTEAGTRFIPESPLFGPLTQDEWRNLQLGHARMHLSFLLPE